MSKRESPEPMTYEYRPFSMRGRRVAVQRSQARYLMQLLDMVQTDEITPEAAVFFESHFIVNGWTWIDE